MPRRSMAERRQPLRSWRIIAKELARETDPLKARALFDELRLAIQLVPSEDGDTIPTVPPTIQPMSSTNLRLGPQPSNELQPEHED
jgi:hypothetical protein